MMMKLVTKVAKNVFKNPSHWIKNGVHKRSISQTKHRPKSLYGAQITLCPECTHSSLYYSSCRFQSIVRKLNMKLMAFRYDLEANPEDFVLSDKMWDFIRGEILDHFDGQLITAMDWEIIVSMKHKPDLSLSYFKYLQKRKLEISDYIKMQFCINCCDKHEELVFDCISELKGSDAFERNCVGRSDILVAISKTRDWRFCLKYTKFDNPNFKTLICSLLTTTLKYKDYKTFLEIWNQSANMILLHGDYVGMSLFKGWQKGLYPVDLLFEVAKLGEVPFSDSQAEELLNYCRNDWHEAVDGKYAKTSRDTCMICKDELPTYRPMDPNIFEEMKKSVVDKILCGRSIYYTSNPKELKKFNALIERTKPYDLVVDALNLHFARVRADRDWFFDMLRNLHYKKGWNILLISRRGHEPSLKGLRDFAHVFFAEKDSQDDVFVILAAFMSGPECYMMTNDQFRDHFAFVDVSLQGHFSKWREQRKIFHTHKQHFLWPPTLQWTCHETDNAWHIPYMRYMSDPRNSALSQELVKQNSRAFLCVQKKNYKPSEECLNFRLALKHSKPSVECKGIKSEEHYVHKSVKTT